MNPVHLPVVGVELLQEQAMPLGDDHEDALNRFLSSRQELGTWSQSPCKTSSYKNSRCEAGLQNCC